MARTPVSPRMWGVLLLWWIAAIAVAAIAVEAKSYTSKQLINSRSAFFTPAPATLAICRRFMAAAGSNPRVTTKNVNSRMAAFQPLYRGPASDHGFGEEVRYTFGDLKGLGWEGFIFFLGGDQSECGYQIDDPGASARRATTDRITADCVKVNERISAALAAITPFSIIGIVMMIAVWHRRRFIGGLVAGVSALGLFLALISPDLTDRVFLAWSSNSFPWGTAIVFLAAVVLTLMPNRRRRTWNRCESCGYDLTGNQSGVCPECGTRMHPRPESDAIVSALENVGR